MIDLNYIQALIQSDTERKRLAFICYDFYQNDTEAIKEHLTTYATTGGMFSTATTTMLPKTHKDITNKVLKSICKLYHSGIDRYLVNEKGEVDETQTELLNNIYEGAGVSQAEIDWYRQGKLFNIVEVKPVWRKVTDKLEFDIWTPNFFSVWSNPENVHYKDLIVFDIELPMPDGTEVDAMEVWTADEHYYMVLSGHQTTIIAGEKVSIPVYEKRSVSEDNPDNVNPYKVIPSEELRFIKGQDYYGLPMLDLVEQNIWYDIRKSNAVYVEIFQGMGIIYAVNMGQGKEIPLTPNTVIGVDNVSTGQIQPVIASVATNAPLEQMRLNLEDEYKNVGNLKGISSKTATENQNAPGISKALDLEEIDDMQAEDKKILIDFERRLFDKVRTIYNYHSTGDKLSENLIFKCDFIEKETPLSEQDKIKKWEFEFQHKLSTPVDYLIEENPDLTIDQAKEQLQENIDIMNELNPQPDTTDLQSQLDKATSEGNTQEMERIQKLMMQNGNKNTGNKPNQQ